MITLSNYILNHHLINFNIIILFLKIIKMLNNYKYMYSNIKLSFKLFTLLFLCVYLHHKFFFFTKKTNP